SYAWIFTNFQKTEGYVATGLGCLWLRCPYLHNGSVPTLRSLLLPPAERPGQFYRGYDLVDAENAVFVKRAVPFPRRIRHAYEDCIL
ncbi:cytochrome c, partial [Rhizobium johnstonii]